MANIAKTHPSPSKASYGRTYDSKLVTREMHRLGTLAPVMSQASSSSSISLPTAGTTQGNIAATNVNDPWGTLHVHVLPLFNGEPLRIPIEDLNVLVRRHISTVVSSAPSKALATLDNDASELIASGMVTLNAKLNVFDDEKLIGRVVEIWGFFWDQVLTYIEGVLLPLQTDSLLSSLYRTPKRPPTPSRPSTAKGSISSSVQLSISPYHIDVRTVALRSFRDRVIVPLAQRLYTRLSMNRQESFRDSTYQVPRLQQMLLVLTSQGRQRPSFSLTPTAIPSQGETAVADLLRVVLAPRLSDARLVPPAIREVGAQLGRNRSFLSDALPRDRRGRVAQKQRGKSIFIPGTRKQPRGEDDSGEETSRGLAGGLAELDRERERVMLESLKSPDPENPNSRASGGWGLGGGNEEQNRVSEDEDDEELNWDQAQALVEQVVGINTQGNLEPRKR